jgi:hypothetical protein
MAFVVAPHGDPGYNQIAIGETLSAWGLFARLSRLQWKVPSPAAIRLVSVWAYLCQWQGGNMGGDMTHYGGLRTNT